MIKQQDPKAQAEELLAANEAGTKSLVVIVPVELLRSLVEENKRLERLATDRKYQRNGLIEERDTLQAKVTELKGKLKRLGSMEAFTNSFSLSNRTADKELLARINYAEQALAAHKEKEGE